MVFEILLPYIYRSPTPLILKKLRLNKLSFLKLFFKKINLEFYLSIYYVLASFKNIKYISVYVKSTAVVKIQFLFVFAKTTGQRKCHLQQTLNCQPH